MAGRVSRGHGGPRSTRRLVAEGGPRRKPDRVLRGAGGVRQRTGGRDHRNRSSGWRIDALEELGRAGSGVGAIGTRNLVYGGARWRGLSWRRQRVQSLG